MLKKPREQFVQRDWPGVSTNEPAEQFKHALARLWFVRGLNLPTGHRVQLLRLGATGFKPYVPFGHTRHADADVMATLGLYVPAGQFVHDVAPWVL